MKHMKFSPSISLVCGVIQAAGAFPVPVLAEDQAPGEARKPNILMISVDDLRPELNMFGAHGMVTPNLDRLAAAGVIFQRAYCQYPVCGPSRASLMSGLRPTRERFVIDRRQPSIDQDAPGTLTISKYLKQNGYTTQALGKIYHYLQDDSEGWSLPVWVGVNHRHCNLEENREIMKNNKGVGPAFECADVPDEAYPDGLIAQEAVRRIEATADVDQPFFLAVGFWRPHLPFNAPKKYWDLYPAEEIVLADNPVFPEGVPAIALHNSPELLGYPGVPRPVHTMDENFARTLIRGYRACVSYIDANIGKLVDALERTGQAKNTVIVLWSDHGFHLGELGMWGKESTFEHSLRTALMAVDLRVSRGGTETHALVELVDVYPTICELACLPVPAHVEGTSFVPLLSDPSKPWKNAAFSCFVRPDQDKVGMSVRTDRWRYTEWRDAAGNVKGETLYDLKNDAEENMNLVGQPELEPVLQEMKEHLYKGWKAALPQP
jgi:iduronate 2-sulfatase